MNIMRDSFDEGDNSHRSRETDDNNPENDDFDSSPRMDKDAQEVFQDIALSARDNDQIHNNNV